MCSFSSCGTWFLEFRSVVAHRLSCPAAYGILPDQGLNPCPLHCQADSQPLEHQGSPFLNSWGLYYSTNILIQFWVLISWILNGTEDEMVRWHHQLDGHEFEQVSGVRDGQGSLTCYSSWGCKVWHNWATELKNWKLHSPWDIFRWSQSDFCSSTLDSWG